MAFHQRVLVTTANRSGVGSPECKKNAALKKHPIPIKYFAGQHESY